jgi:pimeloyl-ACP methyl ester carboxylesterase
MNYVQIGRGTRPAVVFAHGWARTHRDFIPAAESLSGHMASLLVDLPGFGDTPRPPEGWTTADYADHMAGFIRDHADAPIIYVGHSFGARVGLRLAVRHPELLSGLVLVAGAGLPAQRHPLQRWKGRLRQMQFRMLRDRARDEAEREALEARFGSPDYVQSRKLGLRDIFLNAVREDQSADLPRITTPTVLLNGAKDTETTPELGRRMNALIPNSRFICLPEFDHIDILHRGRHVIGLRVKELAGMNAA